MVYFIQSGKSGPIKIGYTEQDIAHRLCDLQVGSAEKLYIMGTIKGHKGVERHMHRKFRAFHIHHEWFTPDRLLLSYIIDVCHNHKKVKLEKFRYLRGGSSGKLTVDSVNKALLESRDNKTEAAQILKVSRATLYRFLSWQTRYGTKKQGYTAADCQQSDVNCQS